MNPAFNAYLAQELIRDRVSEAECFRRARQAQSSDAEVRRVRRFVRSLTAPIRS